MNFKNVHEMLPSEVAAYVEVLHTEITNLNAQAAKLSQPDMFMTQEHNFDSEEELLASLDIGDVVEARQAKRFSKKYMVKISDNRIDSYDTHIQAEHAGMLHSV